MASTATAIKALIKSQIKDTDMTIDDMHVLAVVDSFWGCSWSFIQGGLARDLVPYAGCRAWGIAMDFVYGR